VAEEAEEGDDETAKKKRHTPGRNHQRKSAKRRRKRYRAKVARRRAREMEELRTAWDRWNAMSEFEPKVRWELEPKKPLPEHED
jgi:hypothetical protein